MQQKSRLLERPGQKELAMNDKIMRTPGQRCYEIHVEVFSPAFEGMFKGAKLKHPDWNLLDPAAHGLWESVARRVAAYADEYAVNSTTELHGGKVCTGVGVGLDADVVEIRARLPGTFEPIEIRMNEDAARLVAGGLALIVAEMSKSKEGTPSDRECVVLGLIGVYEGQYDRIVNACILLVQGKLHLDEARETCNDNQPCKPSDDLLRSLKMGDVRRIMMAHDAVVLAIWRLQQNVTVTPEGGREQPPIH